MNTNQKTKAWKFPKMFFNLFLICIFFLYLKFAYLSLSPTIYGKDMEKFAANRNTVKKVVEAKRGSIYDAEGNALAINVSSYTIVVSLPKSSVYTGENYVHDVQTTAEALAPILEADVDFLVEKLSQDKYQVELGVYGRGLTELKKEEIEALNLPGISFTESQKRFYPNGDFASYIIGYAKNKEVTTYDEEENETITTEIVGELGIEAKYNEELSGTDGYLEYQKNKYGYKITGTQEKSVDAQDGNDIYLTIDSNIQRFTESAVKNIESNYSPEWALIAVMDAKTGDILASSSTPSYDPNVKDIKDYENPLITKIYEPGSVMKIYTYMCAMEYGVYNGDDTFESGNYTIGEHVINDWHNPGWGRITFDKGFEYSSNVGIANMLEQDNGLTKKQLKECFNKFGFGKTTGIELANESKGDVSFNYDVEYVNAGFGQGISTTAIQQLQALTLISNNGKMLKPHIVSKIVNSNIDKVVYERKVEESEQLVKTSTIEKMKELMYNVVYGMDAGTTGYTYKIDGFDIIGKTGTSQIYNTQTGTYSTGDNDYIFSFAGMYPKENPEIIIYAAMKKPTWGKSSGLYTNVKSLMENIAKYKNMFTEITEKQTKTYMVKSYLGKDVTSVKQELEENGIQAVIIGEGTNIIKQSVNKNTEMAAGEKIVLLTNSSSYRMPNITGWSRKDAVNLFEMLNLKYVIEGYGYVTSQSIEASTYLTSDMEIHITLANKYNLDNNDTVEN